MLNLFLTVSPEIFIINATSILLIHGVVFSTSKKYDYPPLVSNVGWLGLLSGQRALGCRGAIIAQLPNLMRHRVQTAGNRSMGGMSCVTRVLPPPGAVHLECLVSPGYSPPGVVHPECLVFQILPRALLTPNALPSG